MMRYGECMSNVKLDEIKRSIRSCKAITGFKIVNGELHVYFIDDRGINMIKYFKGNGWKRFFT